MIDQFKLEKLKMQGSTWQARCPVCAESGADKKGNHLSIRDNGNGAFHCVMDCDSKEIFKLVGEFEEKELTPWTKAEKKAYTIKKQKEELAAKLNQGVKEIDPQAERPFKPLSLDPKDSYIATIAQARNISPEAVRTAYRMGSLSFGLVKGHPAWILHDDQWRIAEARRIDGGLFSLNYGDIKAYTLPRSKKAHPIGADWILSHPKACQGIMLVEGGTDYLAALHYIYEDRKSGRNQTLGFVPMAVMGSKAGIAKEYLPIFKDRQISIYQDMDADGEKFAHTMSQLSLLHGAKRCEIITFDGLTQQDGTPANDLNDTTFKKATPDLLELVLPSKIEI